MSYTSKKHVQMTAAILVAVLAIVLLIMGIGYSRRFRLDVVKPSKLNDYGMLAVTEVLDGGGIAAMDEGGDLRYVVIGRGTNARGTDLRDCYVRIDESREEKQRYLNVYIIDPQDADDEPEAMRAPDLPRRPLAIYRVKHQRSTDVIRLFIDGKAAAFSDVASIEKSIQ
jgi:hypothetical protein